jgi:hypothetical protein
LEVKDLVLEAELLVKLLLVNKSFLSRTVSTSVLLLFMVAVPIFFAWIVVLLAKLHLIGPLLSR